MIRTLGIPTFFLTPSAAETRWPELIRILVRVLEKREISDEEIGEMTWEQKCNLKRKDPVTCARYFDKRVRQLFKLIRSKDGPFAEFEVIDFYIRIEFQHRGSPHVHSLLWLKDSPKCEKDKLESKAICEEFFDTFITCRQEQEVLAPFHGLQFHKQTPSCKKMLLDQTICRFGIPHSMPRTVILEPLAIQDQTDEELDEFPGLLLEIKNNLSFLSLALKDGTSIPSFEQFLEELGIEYHIYERVIRTTIKRSKVFLHRNIEDIRTNAFNEEILRRHRANMDLQFLLNPYACVHYILDYINKSNRGMSRLLKDIIEDQKAGNLSQCQKLYRIASKLTTVRYLPKKQYTYFLECHFQYPVGQASSSTQVNA